MIKVYVFCIFLIIAMYILIPIISSRIILNYYGQYGLYICSLFIIFFLLIVTITYVILYIAFATHEYKEYFQYFLYYVIVYIFIFSYIVTLFYYTDDNLIRFFLYIAILLVFLMLILVLYDFHFANIHLDYLIKKVGYRQAWKSGLYKFFGILMAIYHLDFIATFLMIFFSMFCPHIIYRMFKSIRFESFSYNGIFSDNWSLCGFFVFLSGIVFFKFFIEVDVIFAIDILYIIFFINIGIFKFFKHKEKLNLEQCLIIFCVSFVVVSFLFYGIYYFCPPFVEDPIYDDLYEEIK